jgi:hypothetical protein
MGNPNTLEKGVQALVFASPIGLNNNYFPVKHPLNKVLKISESLKDFRFMAKQIDSVKFMLTPKISIGKGLTCGPSLVKKYHSARKIFSEDSAKDACGRQCAIIRQRDCLRF